MERTNSPWSFSIQGLRQRFGLERLEVINDFTAVALAIPGIPRRNQGTAAPESPSLEAHRGRYPLVFEVADPSASPTSTPTKERIPPC